MKMDDLTMQLLDQAHRISPHDKRRKPERLAFLEQAMHRILSDNRSFTIGTLAKMMGVGENAIKNLLHRVGAIRLEGGFYRLHPTPNEVLAAWQPVSEQI